MKDTKSKTHFSDITTTVYENNAFFADYSVCGIVIFKDEKKFVTKNKKKVTCKNCKRTKLFRGVK